MKAVRATLLLLSLAGASFAQSRTTLVDAPLAVLMSMPEAELRALQSEFRQVLARHDAVLELVEQQALAGLGRARQERRHVGRNLQARQQRRARQQADQPDDDRGSAEKAHPCLRRWKGC